MEDAPRVGRLVPASRQGLSRHAVLALVLSQLRSRERSVAPHESGPGDNRSCAALYETHSAPLVRGTPSELPRFEASREKIHPRPPHCRRGFGDGVISQIVTRCAQSRFLLCRPAVNSCSLLKKDTGLLSRTYECICGLRDCVSRPRSHLRRVNRWNRDTS